MRGLEELANRTLIISPEASTPTVGASDSSDSFLWQAECHGIFYNLSLVVPAVFFIAYLASQARRSFAKLSYGRSYIIIAYYALLWIICALNFIWCVLQRWQCTPSREFSWNLLSLFTKSGMLFMEISLIAFLLHGNHASDLEGLTRTFVISGVIVAADVLLKAIYLFGFRVPLFIDGADQSNRLKWGLWIVHRLLLTAVYFLILFLHHSKWKERLPARPAFYNYICVMFLINTVSLFACVLMVNGAGFGFWLHSFLTICYHSFYLPLLYMTFLADFFQEEDLRLENVYYSEMKDAGFFDADWE